MVDVVESHADQPNVAPARTLPHIPALDGLRGLAVAGVVAFHAGHLRGGYLGVDLFFVLSGFLITSLLLVEWESTGTVRLRSFWVRRARRLLPAVLLLLAALAAYGAVALDSTELWDLHRDGLGALAYVANWVAIRSDTDYWAAFSAPSLLEHMWSLAIEEQFYALWPLMALVGLRATGGRRRPLVTVTAALAGASVLALWRLAAHGDTGRAYYGTDTRAAAILYGAIVALLVAGRRRDPGGRVEALLAGAAKVAALVLLLLWTRLAGTDDGLYRWGLPLAGVCAAVIIAVVAGPRAGQLGRLLSLAPLRWLGKISYGLYLWHWPVFVVLDDGTAGLHGAWLTVLRVLVSVALAIVSLGVVETPIRRGWRPSLGWPVVAPAAVAAVAVGLVGATSGASAGLGSGRQAVPAASVPAGTDGSILVVGDSQALVLALAAPAVVAGRPVEGDATIGCGVGPGQDAPDGRPPEADPRTESCAQLIDGWRATIERDQPAAVVLHTGAWDVFDRYVDGRLVPFGTAAWDEMTEARLQEVLAELGATGADVIALTAPCFSASDGLSVRHELRRVERWNTLLHEAAAATGAHVIEYGRFVCPRGRPDDRVEGEVLRGDGVHLSDAGAVIAWRWLSAELARVLDGGGAPRP